MSAHPTRSGFSSEIVTTRYWIFLDSRDVSCDHEETVPWEYKDYLAFVTKLTWVLSSCWIRLYQAVRSRMMLRRTSKTWEPHLMVRSGLKSLQRRDDNVSTNLESAFLGGILPEGSRRLCKRSHVVDLVRSSSKGDIVARIAALSIDWKTSFTLCAKAPNAQ